MSILLIFITALNAVTFLVYGIDKRFVSKETKNNASIHIHSERQVCLGRKAKACYYCPYRCHCASYSWQHLHKRPSHW